MAIQFPTAGVSYTVDFEAASVQAICDAIKNALVICGWTLAASLPSSATVAFSGLPANNQTCTIGGLAYTFVTTLTATVRQIKIGTTAAACATNLMECINAGANSGTDYSSTTTAAGTFTAAVDATGLIVRITSVATGFATNSATAMVPGGWSNTTWAEQTSPGTTWGRGYKMVMPVTPQGLSGAVWLEDTSTTYVRLRVGSPDESVISAAKTARDTTGAWSLNVSAGRYLRFVGCAHQFQIYMVGDNGSVAGTQFFFSVPYVKAVNTPLLVTGASNASPIEITTSVNHGYASGQVVFNADIGGNKVANGSFMITITASNKYTLNGSTGNGAWTSGGLTGSALTQIQRLMLVLGDASTVALQTLRTSAWPGVTPSGSISYAVFECLNGYINNYWGTTTGSYGIRILSVRDIAGNTIPVWGGIPRIVDAAVFWPVLGLNVGIFEVGQLWATFCTQEVVPADRVNTGFLGHNWTQICANSKLNSYTSPMSIWMATS